MEIKVKVLRARECTPARLKAIEAIMYGERKYIRLPLQPDERNIRASAVSRVLNRMASHRYRVRRRGDYLVVRLLS